MYNSRNDSVVLIFTLAVVVLLVIPVVNYANAQAPPGMSNMANIPQMQEVSGKYTNPDSGLEIVLPTGWKGFEMTTANGTIVNAMMPSSDSSSMQSTAMMVSMVDKSKIKTQPSTQPPVNPKQKEQCKQDSSSAVTVNGMNGYQIIMSCTGDVSSKMKVISFQTDKYYISTMFVDTAANFDSNVHTFDSSVNTLQIPNTTGAPSTPAASQPTGTTQISNATVPEFPIAMVGAIMALMMGIGIVAVRRQQLFKI